MRNKTAEDVTMNFLSIRTFIRNLFSSYNVKQKTGRQDAFILQATDEDAPIFDEP